MNGLSPEYMIDLLVLQPTIGYQLRSGNKELHLLRTLSKSGDRAFVMAGPRIWNALPLDTRNSSNTDIFKQHLKAYLFGQAFNL